VPWLWLVLLALIGLGVVAARTLGHDTARPQTTPTVSVDGASRFQSVLTPTAIATRTARTTPIATVQATRVSDRTSVGATATRVTTVVRAPTVGATSVAGPTVLPATAVPTKMVGTATGWVELTFDAGADRGYAEDILDLLQDEHVPGSFGITGRWATANADLVRRMAADGHLVFNHTLDHRSFTGASDGLGGLSPTARRAELQDADAIIAPLIGHTTRPYYRLPYGDDDARVPVDVESAGYSRKIGWTVDSEGWRGLNSADIVARCLQLAAPGAIYVFHVGRASQDAIALPQLIHSLRDRGFAFRRVDQT
jgi:peptidoglycan-N-acetylglucosamine deacetylase